MAHPLIAIVGPTASGKSRLALRLARQHGAEIVSCDSLQVYRGLDIGSAKPSSEERRLVPHHLIDVVDPGEDFSAAEYARRARAALHDVVARGRLPIVAGGSGLYLRALLEGLFAGPERSRGLRGRFEGLADRYGDAKLHRLLGRVDPEAAARLKPRDRVRVVRALEVFWLTGRTLSAHHCAPSLGLAGFRIRILGLDPGRERLLEAIGCRTRQMLAGGLVDEVRGLLAAGLPADLRPLAAIGYRQVVALLLGKLPPEDLEPAIVAATRQYARRQRTWFKKRSDVTWFASVEDAATAAANFLST